MASRPRRPRRPPLPCCPGPQPRPHPWGVWRSWRVVRGGGVRWWGRGRVRGDADGTVERAGEDTGWRGGVGRAGCETLRGAPWSRGRRRGTPPRPVRSRPRWHGGTTAKANRRRPNCCGGGKGGEHPHPSGWHGEDVAVTGIAFHPGQSRLWEGGDGGGVAGDEEGDGERGPPVPGGEVHPGGPVSPRQGAGSGSRSPQTPGGPPPVSASRTATPSGSTCPSEGARATSRLVGVPRPRRVVGGGGRPRGRVRAGAG